MSGFIFKNNSPSCGLRKVFHKKGIGIFAMEFTKHFQTLPVEDEKRLREEAVIKKFVEDVSLNQFKP